MLAQELLSEFAGGGESAGGVGESAGGGGEVAGESGEVAGVKLCC
jgi:hypothetical protein